MKAIREDNRVVDINAGSMNSEWTVESTLYPRWDRKSPHALLSGSDHIHTVRYSTAILFELSVPAKNQPRIHGEVPDPERYTVAWDGTTAVVLWTRNKMDRSVPAAAGQVAEAVLRKAAEKINADLYVQACSEGCRLMFGHRAMRITHELSTDFDLDFTGGDPVEVRVEGTFSKLGLVEAIHDELALPGYEFAAEKNIARRILDLEHMARVMTSELIALDYLALKQTQRNILPRLGFWFGELWMTLRGRGRKKRAAFLIASLWLAMASIETLQQTFADARRNFGDAVSEWALPDLFVGDLQSDELEVEAIDAQFARAAIEHKSTRMDNRVIVAATLGGAMVGGILALLGGSLAAGSS
ncbi:hypothetical protein ACFDTO_28825 [Microbacteriaceae bacterium 4G12]